MVVEFGQCLKEPFGVRNLDSRAQGITGGQVRRQKVIHYVNTYTVYLRHTHIHTHTYIHTYIYIYNTHTHNQEEESKEHHPRLDKFPILGMLCAGGIPITFGNAKRELVCFLISTR